MPSFITYIFDSFGPVSTFFGVSVPGILCLKLCGVAVRMIKEPPPRGRIATTFAALFFGNLREWLLWAALIAITVALLIAFLSSQALAQRDREIAQLRGVLQGSTADSGSAPSPEGRIKVHAYGYPELECWQAQVEVRPTTEIWEAPVVCVPTDEQARLHIELGNGAIGGNPGLMSGVQQEPTEIKDGKWAAFHRPTAITPSEVLYILGDELPSRFVLILTDTTERLAFDLDQTTGQYLPALE